MTACFSPGQLQPTEVTDPIGAAWLSLGVSQRSHAEDLVQTFRLSKNVMTRESKKTFSLLTGP